MAKRQKRKKINRQSATVGLAPETLIFVGEQKRDNLRIDIIDYTEASFKEYANTTLQQCAELAQAETVTWINVSGIHDLATIEAIGNHFHLHPLTIEDIVNTSQRPKTEVFPHYIFIVLKMMSYNNTNNTLTIEHVSLIMGDKFIISFLEDEADVFDAVRESIRFDKGRIRNMQSDFLAYALMDTVVDHYFLALEGLGDLVEEFDDRVLADPRPGDLQEIHQTKRSVLSLRKAVWPLREEVSLLEKTESLLIRPETRVFLRDLYDHTIQAIDMTETLRDLLSGMHDTYLSSVSNRMNEIMKVLTIIATIFIPLTFIAGVYGMNFENMPELKWEWGYYAIWFIMIGLGVSMVLYFKRKKWI